MRPMLLGHIRLHSAVRREMETPRISTARVRMPPRAGLAIPNWGSTRPLPMPAMWCQNPPRYCSLQVLPPTSTRRPADTPSATQQHSTEQVWPEAQMRLRQGPTGQHDGCEQHQTGAPHTVHDACRTKPQRRMVPRMRRVPDSSQNSILLRQPIMPRHGMPQVRLDAADNRTLRHHTHTWPHRHLPP